MNMSFKVQEAYSGDALKGLARLHPDDMLAMNLADGDLIEITGKKTTPARVRAGDHETERNIMGAKNGILFKTSAALEEIVRVETQVTHHFAGSATIQPLGDVKLTDKEKDESYILSMLEGQAVIAGDRVRVNLFGTRICDFLVTATTPEGTVIINKSTYLNVLKPVEIKQAQKVSYEDIGGLSSQIRKVREMIELPLRFPQIFEKLGIQPPRGVLLYGPPGTGKTVIARAVANETDAWFTHISGPEIIGKFYGESEERLRNIFEEAQERAPSIIFIDEIDAIAPKREDMGGEKQVERRVVAQLLALMDGLKSRGQLIVIGATNIPNSLDPALRRPGRFDREIAIPIPDRNGRLEILKIHTRGMPLAKDVDLKKVADLSHGFVGADLEALAKEAAMSCVRDVLPFVNFHAQEIPYEKIAALEVSMKHFMNAFLEVEPSAVREVFVEIPNVSLKDVGGLDNIKHELLNILTLPMKYQDIFARFNLQHVKGILLYGRSGTGKTLLSKALARESGLNFVNVSSANVKSESSLHNIFKVARQAAPSIIYFDEIDRLFPRDSSNTRLVGQLLYEMRGVEDLNGVTVLATANNLDKLDDSLLTAGLFDLKVELPLPNFDARREILEIELRNKPLDSSVDLDELAKLTNNLSGADIALLCRRAVLEALKDITIKIPVLQTQEFSIAMKHFDLFKNLQN